MTAKAALTDTEEWVLQMIRCRPGEWLRPMDLGRPSSVICRGLTGLVRKGLVERRHRAASTAWLYRAMDVM